MLPPDLMDMSDIPAARARLGGLLAMMPAPELPADVTITEVMAPSVDGAPDVRLKLYTPVRPRTPAPARCCGCTAAGWCSSSADGDDFQSATRACSRTPVSRRLRRLSAGAPETPAPGPGRRLLRRAASGSPGTPTTSAWLGRPHHDRGSQRWAPGSPPGLRSAPVIHDWAGPRRPTPRLPDARPSQRDTRAAMRNPRSQRVWNRSANVDAWAAYLGGTEADRVLLAGARRRPLGPCRRRTSASARTTCSIDEDVAYASALNRAGVAMRAPRVPGRVPRLERLPAGPPDVGALEAADEEANSSPAVSPVSSESHAAK